ncbi:MAG: hypothetical protein GW941_01925 [Candidatus Pacebacteria bacterium]|nr:hypothetical protein [Candidatus Paceibacterota bacterium]
MAIKRTKKQKQQTSLKREETLAYSIDDIKIVNKKKKGNKKEVTSKVNNIGITDGFDTSYVLKDLFKTLVVAVLVVGVLVAYTIFGQ